MEAFVGRMIRAMRLDTSLYEEVEADRGANGQALGVVLLSSVAAGIGAMGDGGAFALVIGLAAALFGWIVWAGLIYLVGTKLLPEPTTQSDVGELLRTTGFAAAPGILRVFGGLPLIGWFATVGAAVWMLVAFVIAVRQALDYASTGRAVLVCVIGFCVYMGVMVAAATVVMILTGAAASMT
ncbi:hypothetical protein K8I85_06720 [bacterium]|nr:hypothetical protein [bacterium]